MIIRKDLKPPPLVAPGRFGSKGRRFRFALCSSFNFFTGSTVRSIVLDVILFDSIKYTVDFNMDYSTFLNNFDETAKAAQDSFEYAQQLKDQAAEIKASALEGQSQILDAGMMLTMGAQEIMNTAGVGKGQAISGFKKILGIKEKDKKAKDDEEDDDAGEAPEAPAADFFSEIEQRGETARATVDETGEQDVKRAVNADQDASVATQSAEPGLAEQPLGAGESTTFNPAFDPQATTDEIQQARPPPTLAEEEEDSPFTSPITLSQEVSQTSQPAQAEPVSQPAPSCP